MIRARCLSNPPARARLGARYAQLAALLALAATGLATPGAARASKVDDVAKLLLQDASYKVRVQAAIVLGRLGDKQAVAPLARALKSDENPTVRAMAAQSLGQLGAAAAADGLRDALKTEKAAFVKAQIEKALAILGPVKGAGAGASEGPAGRIYLRFGTFSGGAGDEAALELLRGALRRELAKLPSVTFDERSFGVSTKLGFLIDGNLSRLDDGMAGGAVEINCDVRLMVARWPSKSIILWTNAGAAVQGGSRPRDREIARRDCLEASAGQLAEDLMRFLKSQGA